MLGTTAIGRKSTTKKCTTPGTCEAEHIAMCGACKGGAIYQEKDRLGSSFSQSLTTCEYISLLIMTAKRRSRITRLERLNRRKRIEVESSPIYPRVGPHGASPNFARRNGRAVQG